MAIDTEIIRLAEDGDTLIVVEAYNRRNEKRLAARLIEAANLAEPEDNELESEYSSEEVARYYRLGVDSKSLVDAYGSDVYRREFAELDADERFELLMFKLNQ